MNEARWQIIDREAPRARVAPDIPMPAPQAREIREPRFPIGSRVRKHAIRGFRNGGRVGTVVGFYRGDPGRLVVLYDGDGVPVEGMTWSESSLFDSVEVAVEG